MWASSAIPSISLFYHQQTHNVIFIFFSCTMHYTFLCLFLHLSSAISHKNYWDQLNSWKNFWKFWHGPLYRNNSGEACARKLAQILGNNIDHGGRGIGLRIYVSYCMFLFDWSPAKSNVVNQMSQFSKMVIFTTLFWRQSTLWNSTLKITALCRHFLTLFRRCSTLQISTLTYAQRFFNTDLTFADIATSYHSNNNVETTLKSFLGIEEYC